MALLNYDNFYYFGRGEPEHRISSGLYMVKPFQSEYQDTDYWLIDFFADEGLARIKDYVPYDILERARNGTLILLLHNSHEAFHDIIDPIYDYIVDQLSIPPKQILLLSESAKIMDPINEIARLRGKEPIRAEWIRMFEYNVYAGRPIDDTNYFPCNTLEHKHYEKKFLNLNRRWRFHRPILVALLEVLNVREQGYISLAGHSDGGSNWLDVLSMAPLVIADEETNQLLADNHDKIASIPPLYLDTKDLHINQPYLTPSTDQYYENSYFSIVTETNFYKEFGEGAFLSEKIFKPVFKKHPFIVLSRPGTLQVFRDIGYRSFSEIINEDYDLEQDDDKRMMMIVKEVQRLSNLNEQELSDFLTKAKEICDYNCNHLMQKTSWITKL